MFVFNNCLNDARVLKEAQSLGKAGHEVEIVALLDKKTKALEQHEFFSIKRLALNPIHIRLIRLFSNPFNAIQKLLSKPKKVIPTVTVPKPPFLRRLKRQVTDYREKYVNREGVKNAEWYLKIPLFFSLLIAFIILKLIRLIRIIRSVFLKIKRKIKLLLIALSRSLIQQPLRYLLLPYHKYFVYYDFYKKAIKYSLKYPAEVSHCHDLNTLKIGIKLKQKMGVKLVYDSHELYLHKNRLTPASKFKQRYLRKIESKGMAISDCVITVGDCIAEWLGNEYKTQIPQVVINAPEYRIAERIEDIDLSKIIGIPNHLNLMVYSGSITFNRGIENIIKAVAKVPDVYFVMMGFGTDQFKQMLIDLIQAENVADRISFFGPVAHQEVSTYLSSADFGVAPIMNICLSYYYCAPNKLFEFVQASLPVLASDFPEMSKVVNDYKIGLTFNPADVEDIAESIRTIISDKELQAKFKANTAKAAKRFQWKNEEQKLIDIYTKIAG